MKPLYALFYDGIRSAGRRVSLERVAANLRISGEGIDMAVPLDDIRLSPKVGGIGRSLRLPGGGRCDFADDAALDELLADISAPSFHSVVARWERSLPLVLLALVLTLAVVFVTIRYGMPAVAGHVAAAVPPDTEETLGRQSLEFIDRYLMKPTDLPPEQQKEVRAAFDRIRAGLPYAGGYRLELRNAGKIGANAFALPGGTIVVTDGMIRLTGTGGGLVGVLAHEAAHQRSRHALRQVLQNAGTGLLVAALTGDITTITSLAAALPTTLIDAGYSRKFEYEADDAAVAFLVKSGIEPGVYADVLSRLQEEYDKRGGNERKVGRWSPLDLFASHPETSERIRRILGGTK